MSWDWENSTVDDYGGSADKQDHREGFKPHAIGIYRALQAAQGSAYSKALTGLLHAENLSEARAGAAAMRAAEKLQTNSFPGRSDEAIQYWIDTLGVNVGPDDTDDDVRRKAKARYQAFNGNNALAVNTAVSTLLGAAYVGIVRNGGGSLDSPSFHTYWPVVNPGSQTHDLDGTGAWYSDNAHIFVEVSEASVVNVNQARRMFNVDLIDLLDDMLPAWTTFEWGYESGLAASSGEGVERAAVGE